jgi:hypothetical protein
MNVRPIGVLRMEDDGGGDEKIIAVPSARIREMTGRTDGPRFLVGVNGSSDRRSSLCAVAGGGEGPQLAGS